MAAPSNRGSRPRAPIGERRIHFSATCRSFDRVEQFRRPRLPDGARRSANEQTPNKKQQVARRAGTVRTNATEHDRQTAAEE
jgi:hypothetical protein